MLNIVLFFSDNSFDRTDSTGDFQHYIVKKVRNKVFETKYMLYGTIGVNGYCGYLTAKCYQVGECNLPKSIHFA